VSSPGGDGINQVVYAPASDVVLMGGVHGYGFTFGGVMRAVTVGQNEGWVASITLRAR